MFVNEQKINKNNELYLIIDNFKHYLYKLLFYNFVLNLYFRIKSKINFMCLLSQHSFLQLFITIYRRNYELQIMNFKKR